MSVAHFTALNGLWVALSVFLVLVSLALVYLLIRLDSTVGRLGALIQGAQDDALPAVRKIEETVQRVNAQLDRIDRVTDSAVSAVSGLDAAVRAVTSMVARPSQKVSALAAGIGHGGASLRARRDAREAYRAGREAATRRELELEQELKA